LLGSFSIDRKSPLGKSAAIGSNHISKLNYRVDATRRAYHRALKAFKGLRTEAAAQTRKIDSATTSDGIGGPAVTSQGLSAGGFGSSGR
jgi:hypothetical protein